jgi:sigma-B regulation protein RsbU (phosphoserine phosphatase)
LKPDDLLVVFSDGISEATNKEGEEFGDQGIIESVNRDEREPSIVLKHLFQQLRAFTGDELPEDDMTALILRYRGPEPSASTRS